MRILIVDDEPNIRRTLRVALETMGHMGAEALRDAERQPSDAERQASDVALIDLRLGIPARSTSLDETARTLGINPSTLYRKRKQYGL